MRIFPEDLFLHSQLVWKMFIATIIISGQDSYETELLLRFFFTLSSILSLVGHQCRCFTPLFPRQ